MFEGREACVVREASSDALCRGGDDVAAARETGKLLGVSYYRRLYPKLMRVKQLIANGAIGQVVLPRRTAMAGWRARSVAGCVIAALAGGGPLYDIGSLPDRWR